MDIREKDDRKFKCISFAWLVLCLLATHVYADSVEIEGLFLHIFVYMLLAAPVWIILGVRYLSQNEAFPLSLKAVTGVSLLFIAGGMFTLSRCAEVYCYHDNGAIKALIVIGTSWLFFMIAAYPFSELSVLFVKLRFGRMMRPLSRKQAPHNDVNRDVLELAKLQQRNNLAPDFFQNNDAHHILHLLKMQREGILPPDFFKKNNPADIDDRVDRRFAKEILLLSEDMDADDFVKHIASDELVEKLLQHENILKGIKIIEEEYGFSFKNKEQEKEYLPKLTPF